MIQYRHCSHGLHDRHCPRQHARVMSSLDLQDGLIAIFVNGGLLAQLSGHRLEEHTEIYVLPVGYSSLYTPRVIGESVYLTAAHTKDIILLRASLPYSSETLSVFEALDCIDAEHSGSEVGMKFGKSWFAETSRAPLDDTCDDSTYGVAFSFDLED